MIRPPYALSAAVAAVALLALTACASDDTTAPADRAASPTTAPAELAVASNSWTTGAAMPLDWVNFGAAAINNSVGQPVVYVLGGANTEANSMNSQVVTYNAVTNTWQWKDIDGPNGGSLILRARSHGVARLGDVLYESGGLNFHNGYGPGGNALWAGTDAYQTSTNSLVPVAGFPRNSADGISAAINGKIYVVVGSAVTSPSTCDQFSCPLVSVRQLYRYDAATNTWATRKAPPHYHRSGVGGVINGKFYVVGGVDSKGNATRNLDVYNPATDSWTTLALLPKLLTALKGTVLQNKLYVVSPTGTYVYTPSTNTWAQKATGPLGSAARVDGGAAVTVTLNGKERMIVVGGKRTGAGDLPKTAIYTP